MESIHHMLMSNNIVLTVSQPVQRPGSNFEVQISRQDARNFGLHSGDFIAVDGQEGSVACKVNAVSGMEQGRIYLNKLIRSMLGVSIGRDVTVEKTEVEDAESVSVVTEAPEEQVSTGQLRQTILSRLNGVPIYEGLTFHLSSGPNLPLQGRFNENANTNQEPIKLVVDGVVPDSDFVKISRFTDVNVKRQSTVTSSGMSARIPDVTYSDIGGLNDELERVREVIELPLEHSELFSHLGVDAPKGVILHGPPGTGKTLIAKAVANEVGASFHSIGGPEIMSKHYGGSEEQLREIFEDASEESPSIIFIDELDSIASSRSETQGDVEQRIVAQLLSLMDGLEEREDVIVIGATNRIDSIDNALRRGGRFDREIEIGVPDTEGRREIWSIHTRGMPIGETVDLDSLAERTYGFVGADIAAVVKEAAMTAIRRKKPELELNEDEVHQDVLNELVVTKDDFKQALREVEPSAMREVFVEVPDVSWDDVGGLQKTKSQLQENIEWPLKYEELFVDVGLQATTGVLLYGPPGTGKTMLAKAVANESDVNFISVKGPELLNKYVGESEKGIRDVFSKARENAPTVVFFDEIDAIATERGANNMDSGVSERMVSQLLTELDGLENLEDVMVIATSNRPELIDNALLRPGRIDRQIHVPVPDYEARVEILRVHTQNNPLGDTVDLEEVAELTNHYVGADLESVCRTATMNATRRYLETIDGDATAVDSSEVTVTMEDFITALDEVGPSVTSEVREAYENLEMKLGNEEETATTDSKVAFQ